ncbi:MAG: hypothetical protein H0X36_08545 [Sphingomonadaceae bacterium]|nr:hypothetical protein [Sphingomonadaceae bacterium]
MMYDSVVAARRIAPAAGKFGEKQQARRQPGDQTPDPAEFAARFIESGCGSASHRCGEGAHPLDLVA